MLSCAQTKRVPIYNAMSLEGVTALVELMQDFAARKA